MKLRLLVVAWCTFAAMVAACSTPGGNGDGEGTGGQRLGTGGAKAGTGGAAAGGAGGGANGGSGGTGGVGTGGMPGSGGASSGGTAGADAAGGGAATDASANEAGAGEAGAAAVGPAGGDCPAGASYGEPVPSGATATLVKGGFVFTEGPVWVAAQKALFFTDFNEDGGSNGRIQKYTPGDGKFQVFVDKVGVNGLAIDVMGSLVGAAHDVQGISRFDVMTGARTMIPGGGEFGGKKFNSPNDVVVHSNGNIYFTDPTYQRPAGSAGQGVTAFYRWKDGTLTRHEAGPQPNAIGISIDGKWLYVTSVMSPPVYKFALGEDGAVGARSTFVNMISQGFAHDCAGNVYLTANQKVHVFSAAGEPRGTIGGFPENLTNLAFGDEDRKTLYITARPGSLYKVRLNVPGFPN